MMSRLMSCIKCCVGANCISVTLGFVFLSLFSCGGIGIINHRHIDKPKFIEEFEFKDVPQSVQDIYLANDPSSIVEGFYPARSYESIFVIRENQEIDTISVLYVNREFWTTGLGGMPSKNNKGNLLKSGFHFSYKGKKFYVSHVGGSQPLIIMDETLYLYDSYKNAYRYPYEINKYDLDISLDTCRVNVINLRKWL